MRLELGSRVDCTDEEFGELVDVVVDPATRRLTHLVVEPRRKDWVARLVPIGVAQTRNDASRAVELRMTVEQARRLPPVYDAAFLRLGDLPVRRDGEDARGFHDAHFIARKSLRLGSPVKYPLALEKKRPRRGDGASSGFLWGEP